MTCTSENITFSLDHDHTVANKGRTWLTDCAPVFRRFKCFSQENLSTCKVNFERGSLWIFGNTFAKTRQIVWQQQIGLCISRLVKWQEVLSFSSDGLCQLRLLETWRWCVGLSWPVATFFFSFSMWQLIWYISCMTKPMGPIIGSWISKGSCENSSNLSSFNRHSTLCSALIREGVCLCLLIQVYLYWLVPKRLVDAILRLVWSAVEEKQGVGREGVLWKLAVIKEDRVKTAQQGTIREPVWSQSQKCEIGQPSVDATKAKHKGILQFNGECKLLWCGTLCAGGVSELW